MDEKPEVIEKQIEATRHALAEKLDRLEGQFGGTLGNISETAENISESVEHVSDTAENVTETVETVSAAGKKATEAVVDALDIPRLTRNHPWLVVGGAVLAGYLGGRLMHSGTAHTKPSSPASTSSGKTTGLHESTARGNRSRTIPTNGERQAPQEDKESWVEKVGDTMGDELNTLKGLALGSLFGVARDMITSSLPKPWQQEINGVFDRVTEHAGGKPIRGNVVDESNQHEKSVSPA